jgi:hypothetical protein
MRRQILPEELNYFYQKTGEAIWHLQYVEEFIVKLYIIKEVIKEPGSLTEARVEIELKKFNKLPLGPLIKLLENSKIVSQILIDKLNHFNQERKWIVHNSNRENGELLYTDEGKYYFLERITKFTELALELQKNIDKEVVKYTIENAGVDEAFINSEAYNRLAELQGEV